MEENNITSKGIQIANDGSIKHTALTDIKHIVWKNIRYVTSNPSNYASISSVDHLKHACQLSRDVFLLLDTRSLNAIWDILSKFEVNSESRISANEFLSRQKDLYLDIKEFYNASLLKSVSFYELRDKDFEQYVACTKIQKFNKFLEDVQLRMDDLDQRLLILMKLVNPSSVTTRIARLREIDQIKVITEDTKILTKKFNSKTAGKAEIQSFVRLSRRMYIFLLETNITELSPEYQERFDYITLMKDSPEEDHKGFQQIVDDMNVLQEDIKEFASMCAMKCSKYQAMMFPVTSHGGSENYYCCKKIIKFVDHVSNFYQHIHQQFVIFTCRTVRVRLAMNVQ